MLSRDEARSLQFSTAEIALQCGGDHDHGASLCCETDLSRTWPVENRLADIHSQFEFILPGYLAATRAEFEKDYGRLGSARGARHRSWQDTDDDCYGVKVSS